MIAKAMADIMLADVALTNDVGDRVNAGRSPRRTAAPRIILRVPTLRPLDVIDGFPECDEARVQVDVVTTDDDGGYIVLQRIGDRCRTLLEGFTGESAGHVVQGCSVDSDIETHEAPNDGSDVWLKKRSITFRVTATNNVARL